MKKFLSNKSFGFYVTAALALLSIVSAIIYRVTYAGFYSGNQEVFSRVAFWFLLGWIPCAIALYVFKQGRYANYLAAIALFVALLTYVNAIYYYVSVMEVGIDASFTGVFFLITILFVFQWILALANVFFPQEKGESHPSDEKVTQ